MERLDLWGQIKERALVCFLSSKGALRHCDLWVAGLLHHSHGESRAVKLRELNCSVRVTRVLEGRGGWA